MLLWTTVLELVYMIQNGRLRILLSWLFTLFYRIINIFNTLKRQKLLKYWTYIQIIYYIILMVWRVFLIKISLMVFSELSSKINCFNLLYLYVSDFLLVIILHISRILRYLSPYITILCGNSFCIYGCSNLKYSWI